ncbi:unnamed protein product [Pleuronectes platessa]|uniref:Ig-like domain-containing protein n=1 Tax=Pleuronectes platessa TaxID=8262 RepID=A0A9N7YZM1_PLEPL|nr:unnamed protein product [Pleuronectes platessa]
MFFMVFIFCCLHLPGNKGAYDTKNVVQKPPSIFKRTGESVDSEINCSHDIKDLDIILWYKQVQHDMEYLGYLNRNMALLENDLPGQISFDGDGKKYSDLTVSNLSISDSGVYFCAVRQHSATKCPQVNTKTLESTPDKQDVQEPKHLASSLQLH